MQALILTAGAGTRLKPLTDTLPKCLIPVAGRPVLDYQLEALRANGVEKIWVMAGAHAESVKKHLRGTDVRVLVNAEYASTNILYSFALALEEFPAKESIVLAGDVVFEPEVIARLSAAAAADVTLCVNRRACGEEEVKVILEKDRALKLGKALDPKSAYGEFLGVFRASEAAMRVIVPTVRAMTASGRSDYLFDMLNRLIAEKNIRVSAMEVNELLWEEIDYPEDVERATRKLSGRKAGKPA